MGPIIGYVGDAPYTHRYGNNRKDVRIFRQPESRTNPKDEKAYRGES
jgi:hypothetical protein